MRLLIDDPDSVGPFTDFFSLLQNIWISMSLVSIDAFYANPKFVYILLLALDANSCRQ